MSIQEQIDKQSEKLTSLLQIEAPLIAAPMMGVTTAEMTAAFSNAGGLGVMPCGIMKPERILETVKTIKELTDKPFALNLRVPPREAEDEAATKILFDALEPLRDELGVAHQLAEIPTFDEQFEAVLQADVPVVSFSFGGPREVYAEALEARDILMMGAVNSTREAKVLKTAGCFVIIAQGAEAGGISHLFGFDRSGLDGHSQDGAGLGSEGRTLTLTEDMPVAQGALEALLQGPEDTALRAAVTHELTVLAVRLDESSGICYVNFSTQWWDCVPESLWEQRLMLFSIVNTLCSMDKVTQVQLLVDGAALDALGGLNISGPVSPDWTLVGAAD